MFWTPLNAENLEGGSGKHGRIQRANKGWEVVFEDGWRPELRLEDATLVLRWKGAEGRALESRLTRDAPNIKELRKRWLRETGTSLENFNAILRGD